jgi:hypothetical protein
MSNGNYFMQVITEGKTINTKLVKITL